MNIVETSSVVASRNEVAAYWAQKQRQQQRMIADCCVGALDGRTNGWFFTVNTKVIISNVLDNVEAIEYQFDRLDKQLGALSSRMNEFCYRRRPNRRLKVLCGLEIGKKNGRLHAHGVAVHSNDVNRTLPQINREIVKQWQRVYKFDEAGFVNVQEISDIVGAVSYVTKKTDIMTKKFGRDNIRQY